MRAWKLREDAPLWDGDGESGWTIRLTDWDTMRAYDIVGDSIGGEDIAFIRDMLNRMAPDMHDRMIAFARLVIKASQN